jgi:hypothetical protein
MVPSGLLFMVPGGLLFMVPSGLLFMVPGGLLFVAAMIPRFLVPHVLLLMVSRILSMPVGRRTHATGPARVGRAVRGPADGPIVRSARRQLRVVWFGRSGKGACSGERTATNDDSHSQPLPWRGGLWMFARVARHQQVCADQLA